MVYYQNFKQTLGYYSAEKWGEMDQSMNSAEEARLEDPVLLYVKANFLVEKKKIKQAKELYQTILSQGYIDTLPARVGLIVCKLYESEEEKDKNKMFQLWSDMERELQALAKEDKNFSDIPIALAHIYYKKGIWLDQEGDKKKSKAYLDNAWQTFLSVEKSSQEFSALLQSSDVDLDNFISKSEWKGKQEQWEEIDINGDGLLDRKEMASLWNPPSRGACQSLYIGKALMSYHRGQELWQQLSHQKPSAEILDNAGRELCTSLECLQQAHICRMVNPELPCAIVALYKKMMSHPWLPDSTRKELIQSAVYYNQDLEMFCTHLRGFQQSPKLEEWLLRKNISDLYLGMAISSYYLGRQADSWAYFERASSEEKEERRSLIQDNKMQSLVGFMDREYNIRKRIEVYMNRAIYEYYEKAMEGLPKEGNLTTREFLIMNNYVALRYLKGRTDKVTEYCKEAQKLLEQFLPRIPDQQFYAEVKEDPVNAKQIATHNLYMITRYNDAKKASVLKLHQLTREAKEK